jgi:hypothetical protein
MLDRGRKEKLERKTSGEKPVKKKIGLVDKGSSDRRRDQGTES